MADRSAQIAELRGQIPSPASSSLPSLEIKPQSAVATERESDESDRGGGGGGEPSGEMKNASPSPSAAGLQYFHLVTSRLPAPAYERFATMFSQYQQGTCAESPLVGFQFFFPRCFPLVLVLRFL